jgi:hypothetical protein
MLQLVHAKEADHTQNSPLFLGFGSSVLDQNWEPSVGHAHSYQLKQASRERADGMRLIRSQIWDLRFGDFGDAATAPEVLVLAVKIR